MSGIAIIIQNADFSAKNLGTVSFLEDTSVIGLSIDCENSYSATSFSPTIIYSPVNTNQIGVIWSITSGSQYASINKNTGKVTINEGVSNQSITILAKSVYNNEITATKTVNITYYQNVDILESISIIGSSTVEGKTSTYTVMYNPENTIKTGVTWSIHSGSNYASIDANTGVLTIGSTANNNSVTIRATSTQEPSIYTDKVITVTYQAYTPIFNIFDESASDEFGGSQNGYLIATPASKNCTINYIKLKVSPNSPTGRTIKIYKSLTYPIESGEIANISMLGYIVINSSDLGKTVVKEVNGWNVSAGEYILISSPDGCLWLGDNSDNTLHFTVYNISNGRYENIDTSGNVNVEFME